MKKWWKELIDKPLLKAFCKKFIDFEKLHNADKTEKLNKPVEGCVKTSLAIFSTPS